MIIKERATLGNIKDVAVSDWINMGLNEKLDQQICLSDAI